MMLTSNSIGNKIADARKKNDLSQAELAQQVHISSQAVGKWERGESLPDIPTLNLLAKILGVDLNYFSENFQTETMRLEPLEKPSWNMSHSNLVDNDFSGLKNLHEKFSGSNMQRCLFIGSSMSGLLLKGNNIDTCDFSGSDISKSNIQNSNIGNDVFKNCSLKQTQFSNSNINGCDFTGADFTGAGFRSSMLTKNTLTNAVWNNTSFNATGLSDIIFEGVMENCFFENCGFHKVIFQNATLTNTFFKNSRRLKRVQFVDCKADKLTYAFLKAGQADLSGITLLKD
jgi:uncharacterized protein YjbI with pentapeptide repeats